MHFWLVNHSWQSFKVSEEYCGFVVKEERDKISVGDKIVYFGQGLVFGVFEASQIVDAEFNGWQNHYPFQVKLTPVIIAEKGIIAKPLEEKIKQQKQSGGSPNLLELSETEFNLTKKAVEKKQKEIRFY